MNIFSTIKITMNYSEKLPKITVKFLMDIQSKCFEKIENILDMPVINDEIIQELAMLVKQINPNRVSKINFNIIFNKIVNMTFVTSEFLLEMAYNVSTNQMLESSRLITEIFNFRQIFHLDIQTQENLIGMINHFREEVQIFIYEQMITNSDICPSNISLQTISFIMKFLKEETHNYFYLEQMFAESIMYSCNENICLLVEVSDCLEKLLNEKTKNIFLSLFENGIESPILNVFDAKIMRFVIELRKATNWESDYKSGHEMVSQMIDNDLTTVFLIVPLVSSFDIIDESLFCALLNLGMSHIRETEAFAETFCNVISTLNDERFMFTLNGKQDFYCDAYDLVKATGFLGFANITLRASSDFIEIHKRLVDELGDRNENEILHKMGIYQN